jgi:hypothetical protein
MVQKFISVIGGVVVIVPTQNILIFKGYFSRADKVHQY